MIIFLFDFFSLTVREDKASHQKGRGGEPNTPQTPHHYGIGDFEGAFN